MESSEEFTQPDNASDERPAETMGAYAKAVHELSIGNDAMTFDRGIERDFVIAPKALTDSRDPRHVGYAAAGVWMAMKGLPPNWRFSVKGFVSISDEGYTTINAALAKLQSKAWVLCFRRRESGRWTAGSLWHVMDDPRRAGAAIELFEGFGLTLVSKVDPAILKPQVATRYAKRVSGPDQAFVENSSYEGKPNVENSGNSDAFIQNESENPRSQPDMRFPYMENQTLFNNINNIKNKKTPIQAKRQAAGGGDRNREVAAFREEGGRPESDPEPTAQADPGEGRGASAPLAGPAPRPFTEEEKAVMRRTFDSMGAACPKAVPKDEHSPASIAYAKLVRAGRDPEVVERAWKAFVRESNAFGETTLLDFFESEQLIEHWSRRASEETADGATREVAPLGSEGAPRSSSGLHGRTASFVSDAPVDRDAVSHPERSLPQEGRGGDSQSGFDELLGIYPRPPRGEASRGRAAGEYRVLVSSGLSEAEILAAARAYRDCCSRNGTEPKYIRSLANFLSSGDGARYWAGVARDRARKEASASMEGKSKAVRRALDNVGCARRAELVTEFAESSDDAKLRGLAASVRADASDGRLHCRRLYPALERSVRGREHRASWVEWAYARLNAKRPKEGVLDEKSPAERFEKARAAASKAREAGN
jgi:hypothetical protein